MPSLEEGDLGESETVPCHFEGERRREMDRGGGRSNGPLFKAASMPNLSGFPQDGDDCWCFHDQDSSATVVAENTITSCAKRGKPPPDDAGDEEEAEMHQSIHYCRHCLRRPRLPGETGGKCGIAKRKKHFSSDDAEDPKEWERRSMQGNIPRKKQNTQSHLINSFSFAVPFSTLPFLLLAPSISHLHDSSLLISCYHLAAVIAATLSISGQHRHISRQTSLCLAALIVFLALQVAPTPNSHKTNLALYLIMGCFAAPANVAVLEWLRRSRHPRLVRNFLLSSGGLPLLAAGTALLLLPALGEQHSRDQEAMAIAGNVKTFPASSSSTSSWDAASSSSSSSSRSVVEEQSAGDQTNRLRRAQRGIRHGEEGGTGDGGLQWPSRQRDLFVYITKDSRGEGELPYETWQSLVAIGLIVAASTLAISVATAALNGRSTDKKDGKHQITDSKEKKKKRKRRLSPARLSLVPMLVFLGLQEGFMSRYLYRDAVTSGFGLKCLSLCLVFAGVGSSLATWMCSHCAGHWSPREWRKTAVGVPAVFFSLLLLAVSRRSPSSTDVGSAYAVAFGWGVAVATAEAAVLYSLVDGVDSGGSAHPAPRHFVASRHLGLLLSYGVGGAIQHHFHSAENFEVMALIVALVVAASAMSIFNKPSKSCIAKVREELVRSDRVV